MKTKRSIENRRSDLLYYANYPDGTRPGDWADVFNIDFRSIDVDVVRARLLNKSIDRYVDRCLGQNAPEFLASEYCHESVLDKDQDHRFVHAINKLWVAMCETCNGDIVADMVRQANPRMNYHTADRVMPGYLRKSYERSKDRFTRIFLKGKDPRIGLTDRRARQLANLVSPGRFKIDPVDQEEADQVDQAVIDETYAWENQGQIEKHIRQQEDLL